MKTEAETEAKTEVMAEMAVTVMIKTIEVKTAEKSRNSEGSSR
jgi:hypothetical protein